MLKPIGSSEETCLMSDEWFGFNPAGTAEARAKARIYRQKALKKMKKRIPTHKRSRKIPTCTTNSQYAQRLITIRNTPNVETTKIRISLIDPCSRCIIDIPVRGQSCQHLQPFDLHWYHQMTGKYSRICFICHRQIYLTQLIYDKYLHKIFSKIKRTTPSVQFVDIYNDRTWKAVKPKKTKIIVLDET